MPFLRFCDKAADVRNEGWCRCNGGFGPQGVR